MANKIKISRGTLGNIPTLERGELVYTTDTKQLYIGVLEEPNNPSDNMLIASIEDFFTKTDISNLDGTGLVWNQLETRFDIDFAGFEESVENETKVMNPKRTDEAITERLNARLTAEAYATESQLTSAINTLPGTGLTLASGVLNINDPFNSSGNFENLRARGTLAEDVGLGNVTNQSKATMFTDPTFTGIVTVPDPTVSGAATNKSYVDALAQGIKARSQALVYVDFDLDATYDDQPELHELTANNNEAFPDVDGILSTVLNVEGARILVAGQTNPEENGLYVLKTVGVDGVTAWVLRRCTQCDTSEKIPGSFVFVTKGTQFENTG